MFDCGRGVLLRSTAAGVGANQLTATLLTHLHSDHLTDLNDVITTRWITTFSPTPLVVIGPPHTGEVVDGIRASLRPDVSYRIAHHDDLNWEPPVEVTELTEGVAFEAGGVRIVAAPTDHRPAQPSVGYRVELTHCVPAVAPGAEDEWRAIAAAGFAGTIVVAADLDRVSIG